MDLARMWRSLSSVVADEVADDVFPRRQLAGVLGLQYVVGGALALAYGLLGPEPAGGTAAFLVCGTVAVVAGLVMGVLCLARLSAKTLTAISHSCIVSAQVVIAAGHLISGVPGSPVLLFVLWTAPYAGIFSPRARWLHLAASAAVILLSAWWLPWPTTGQTVVEVAIRVATVVVSTLLVSRMTAGLRRSATQDPLTGLPNRRVFHAATRAALARRSARGGSVLVLLLDLDRFKHVNDTFGHETGDALLLQVVPRLLSTAGPSDVVARLGGDEFAVMVEDPDGTLDAARVAERLRRVWTEPVDVDGRALHVSGSIGVAVAGPEDTPRTLLRDADAAMYESKRTAPGGFLVFHDDLAERANRLLLLEQGLQRAAHLGELAVHYQPVVALVGERAGQVVGAEALVRWHSAELGHVGPDEFIPVAEQAGLIGALGDWVLDRALADLAGWHAQGAVAPGFHVAVNVSAHQLTADLPGRVATLLERYGLCPAHLGLEVTESAVMHGGTAPEVLARLNDLGVTLLLDDFGTGYSSLSQLRELPFDVVKVDRSFVGGMLRHRRDRALVQAALSLAGALGMSVIAEGVEEEEQAAALRAAGCPAAQGWLFSRPVPAAALPAAVRAAARDVPGVPAPVH
ncbi:hypothetical protein NUM3379_40310 [Kineococcus sp. NUM-3379]